ncbi:barstar family protein [Cellulomonas sp. DKR-3]|uniref:Barstar family protein n=1 Tax=Cellulomonas fulva TaxID=2835530 RepID=A0ABS5TWP2_9CELL|nr:barstar family protein [Cellulomonas fulva]
MGGLFDEVSAALQFPYYFGENWPAFDECLADMDWLPLQVGIVVTVLDAVEVLSDEPSAELGTLARTIAHASETYAEPIASGEWWDRPALPFHVVLQAREDQEGLVRARWGASGAMLSVLG